MSIHEKVPDTECRKKLGFVSGIVFFQRFHSGRERKTAPGKRQAVQEKGKEMMKQTERNGKREKPEELHKVQDEEAERRRMLEQMGKLYDVVAALRKEGGCPWDRAQTHRSLKPYLIEEAYETVDAVTALEQGKGSDMLREELGDLLFQIMLHSEIAREENEFTLSAVAEGICKKMVHRHPGVFQGSGEETRKKDWDTLKKEEKPKETPEEEIARVPHCFPALLRTQKVQKKMERYEIENIPAKEAAFKAEALLERLEDTRQVCAEDGGELLYEICRILRKSGIDAEQALKDTLEKRLKEYGEKQNKDSGGKEPSENPEKG